METSDLAQTYRQTWLILLGLMALSVTASALHLGPTALTLTVFGVALVKAGLVLKRFMHFEQKRFLLVLALSSPLFLLAAFIGFLWLDFVGVNSGPHLMR